MSSNGFNEKGRDLQFTDDDRSVAIELGVAPEDFDAMKASFTAFQQMMKREPLWQDAFLLPAPDVCWGPLIELLLGMVCVMFLYSWLLFAAIAGFQKLDSSDDGRYASVALTLFLAPIWVAVFGGNGGLAFWGIRIWVAVFGFGLLVLLIRFLVIRKWKGFADYQSIRAIGDSLIG